MARRFTPAYTVGDIMALYELRKSDGDEGRLRRLAATFRALCRLENQVSIPDQYKAITREVRTPFVRDAWSHITSSLCAKPPVVHITPRDDAKEEYRSAASIAERFDLAMIERLTKERGVDIVYALTAALVRDGESVLKVVHRPDAWARFPERAADEEPDDYRSRADEYKRGVDLPIAWRDVDRLSMVYEGGEYGDVWAIEYGEYSRAYCHERYRIRASEVVTPDSSLEGKGLPEGLQASSTGVRVKVEFWTANEWHVIIDGREAPGWPRPNPYSPYIPYFRATAHDMESLLYSLMFLVPRLDELLTMKLNWSYLGAYPNPIIETMPNSGAFPSLDGPLGNAGDVTGDRQAKLTWQPGKALTLPLGKTMRFLDPPPVGKDLNDLVLIIKSLIDVAGIPSIMRGTTSSGESGYLGAQLRDAAEMQYRQAMLALQRQQERALEFSHWLISNVVRQTVYVLGWEAINQKTGRPKQGANQAWLGLSPERGSKNVADLGKLGPVSVQFRPTLATNQQAMAMIALQLTNAANPLSSRRHAAETWLQEEDWDSIADQIAVERAEDEEPLRSIIRDQALREAGLLPNTPAPMQQVGGLVDQYGQPMSPGLQGGVIAAANQAPPGVPGVPGLTMPLTPPSPAGIPGNAGGRPAGMYPGQPGGPRMR